MRRYLDTHWRTGCHVRGAREARLGAQATALIARLEKVTASPWAGLLRS